MTKISRVLALPIFICFFLLSGCEKDNYGINPNNKKDKFVFDVTWTEETTYFDEDALDDLERVDSEDHRYYFNSSNTAAANLNEGDIIVIHGLALRKVSSIEEVSNQIVVETEYAQMNEAIADGEVEWDYGVNFDSDLMPELLYNGQRYPFKKSKGDSLSLSMNIGKFAYKISMKFNGDKADVTQEIERSVGGVTKVRFICQGVIESFRTSNKITYKNSEVQTFDNNNKGLKGELKLSLDAAGSGSDKINFEFPATLLTFPFTVGPIPVMVSLKVQFVAAAVVPPEGSSRIAATFTYDSSTGLNYSLGGGIKAGGSEGKHKIKKEIAQTGAASAIGINFGLGFPRLEIALFGETIVPWVQTAFLIGGDFTFLPACQTAKAAYIGAVGYKLGFLGLGYEDTKTLWNIEEILLKAGDCDKSPQMFTESLDQLGISLE